MLEKLRKEVAEANRQLYESGLSILTWGNVSGFSRDEKLVVIKPSGIGYEGLTADKMVVVDLSSKIVEGTLNPSSDTPVHLELYRKIEGIAGIAHTHSPMATSWAQAQREIPCLGTTHADYFSGPVPCTRVLTEEEVSSDYELNTGRVIIELLEESRYADASAVLVAGHGPFTWGKNPRSALENSIVLEETAKIAFYTLSLNSGTSGIPGYMIEKHFMRKHGDKAYYGQKKD